MLRKRLLMTLAMLLVISVLPIGWAEEDINEDLIIDTVAPEEPVITEGEFIRVTAEYLAGENITRHTAELINNPTFSDGSPLTAQDLLFSLYVYLDPGYPLFNIYRYLIPGVESYEKQISPERLTEANEIFTAIEAAGEDHVWSESDDWTQEHQNAYLALCKEYSAACEAEFPQCAQAIVDACMDMLTTDMRGAFGRGSDEIAIDENLHVAYAMLQWGYADADGSILTARYSGAVWNLEEQQPTVNDFASELSLAYRGDLSACWAIETTGTYEPALPNVKEQFIADYLGDQKDSVTSISGIRLIDESTIQVDLEGIDMHGSPFNLRVLSLSAVGDLEKWSPETGLYGHDFGDVSDIEAAGFDGPILLEGSDEIIF